MDLFNTIATEGVVNCSSAFHIPRLTEVVRKVEL